MTLPSTLTTSWTTMTVTRTTAGKARLRATTAGMKILTEFSWDKFITSSTKMASRIMMPIGRFRIMRCINRKAFYMGKITSRTSSSTYSIVNNPKNQRATMNLRGRFLTIWTILTTSPVKTGVMSRERSLTLILCHLHMPVLWDPQEGSKTTRQGLKFNRRRPFLQIKLGTILKVMMMTRTSRLSRAKNLLRKNNRKCRPAETGNPSHNLKMTTEQSEPL